MKYLAQLIFAVIWISGMVLAKGFWSTFFAVITSGLWSMYLVSEKIMQMYGFI